MGKNKETDETKITINLVIFLSLKKQNKNIIAATTIKKINLLFLTNHELGSFFFKFK